jgi:hypothetical protein
VNLINTIWFKFWSVLMVCMWLTMVGNVTCWFIICSLPRQRVSQKTVCVESVKSSFKNMMGS